MKEWILKICVVAFIATLLTMILPQGKMGKYIKGVFSVIVMLVVLQPLIGIDLENVAFDFNGLKAEPAYQQNYLDFINEKRIEYLEKRCNAIIDSLDVRGGSVVLNYSEDENRQIAITKVSINLEDAVIISDDKHIDIIEEIKSALSEYLSVNKEIMEIYG